MNIIILPISAFDDRGGAIITDPKQLSHIKNVLKATVGDTLKIGQLGQNIGKGEIAQIDDKICQLKNVILDQFPPPKLQLTVILALPRPKVLRRLILDMTAFGVSQIILINSARTDKSYWGSPLLGKIDEFILEGLQQGIDTVPPTITFEKRFKPFVQDSLSTFIQNKHAVVLHPYTSLHFKTLAKPDVVIIGAEGGFVPYEIELLQSVGVEVATLGSRILRTESAVNAILGHYL